MVITAPCYLQMNIENMASPSGLAIAIYGGFTMEDNNKNALYCSHCGALIDEDDDYEEVNG